MALQKDIRFGSIQIVDSVQTLANVNTKKDEQRQERKGKGPRDPDARWGAKHKHKVRTPEGKEEQRTEYFFGYKMHTSLNAENGLITALEVTSGEAYDGHHLYSLVDRDLEQQLPVETYAADKGYDDGNNHFYLEYRGLHSAINLIHAHTTKKNPNKQPWLTLLKTPQYHQGRKE